MSTRAHVTLVTDRSLSMQAIKDEAEAGVKLFAEQQATSTTKTTLALYQFDTTYEHVYGPVKAAHAPAYELQPRGMTALYDAIGLAIRDTEKIVAESKKTPDKVAVVIMTDGEENSSHEFTFETVSKLIEAKQAEGWEIVFLAGTLKAADFGHASGLTTRSYNPRIAGQTMSTYADASNATMDWAEGKTKGINIADDPKVAENADD